MLASVSKTYDNISRSLPAVRSLAILWIVAYHVMGYTRGYLSIEDAIATLAEGNIGDILRTGLDLFISAGDAGVNIFLIISGFGLTTSWWNNYGRQGLERIPLQTFWKKRALRILPRYWSVVAIAFTLFLIYPAGFPFAVHAWHSGGLTPVWALLTTVFTARNLSPHHYYFLNPAWWYVGLSLQLYLIFPLLIWLGCRQGWCKLLIATFLFSMAYRLVCIPLESDWKIVALGVLPSRLFEFVFGMCLSITSLELTDNLNGRKRDYRKRDSHWAHPLLLNSRSVSAGFSLFFVGYIFKWLHYPALSIFEDALIGVGSFCGFVGLSYLGLSTLKKLKFNQCFNKMATDSYAVYLTHMVLYPVLWPVVAALVPAYWICFVLVILACFGLGIAFELCFTAVLDRFQSATAVSF